MLEVAMLYIQAAPTRWSCLLAAFATVLDEKCRTLINEIGHDGSEIIWPELPEPLRRRGFHIQELIDCAMNRGRSVTEIQAEPTSISDSPITYHIIMLEERINRYLDKYTGVLTGTTQTGKRHAVAYQDRVIFDPKGDIYQYNNSGFTVESFFIIS